MKIANHTTIGALQMSAAMVMAGTIGFFVLKSKVSLVEVVFWRCLFGAFFLAVYCLFFSKFKAKYLTVSILLYILVGAVTLVANWFFLFKSYTYSSISVATTVYNTQPFILMFLGTFFYGVKNSCLQYFWLFLSFCGVTLLALGDGSVISSNGISTDILLGVFFAFVAAFFYAVTTLLMRNVREIPSANIAFLQVFFGAAILLPFVEFSPDGERLSSLLILAVLGFFHTGLMYILLYSAIKKLPIYLIASISFLYPLTAFFVDIFAFSLKLGIAQYIGAVLVIFSSLMASIRKD
ncbi:DMT family transporter [Shewanella algae]|uniref:DMT family transporter n=1 Tax=Shewanella algae TaxID=38313 RepID=UPI0031F50303